ncbi:MAG: cupin domain-containing protein [Deltaproteobacteria bacterium]|nr:cupin domain-containing protein [Deltaproteobacteria bacterium]
MAHEIFIPGFERNDERGLFLEIINSGEWKAVNWARMLPGASLGNHYHKKATMFFYLISGSAHVKTIDINSGERDEFELSGGQGVFFPPLESHIIIFSTESEVLMLKSLSFDPSDPDICHHPV